MDRKKIEEGVRLILEGIGENPEREGLQKTPRRVAEMCEEILEGTGQTPELDFGFTEDVGPENLIVIKDISFYSLCEHHLLPFFGKVKIVYAPQNNRVAGFSDFARVVDICSRRLQLQERLTNQVADAIWKALQPAGVRVIIEATQLCVSMRGTHKKDIITVTEVLRGSLPSNRIQDL